MGGKIGRYLSKLEGNARICTAMFPLWAIPFTVYNFYLSLYLKHYGFTDLQIGSIMVVANISALVCSLIAAPVVDRLGRRWATLLFDLASSVIPPLLFILWPTYSVAIIAMALTGLNRIMSIGYYLLLVEDNSQQNSVVSMNLFNLILVLSGLATPLAGIIVARRGLVASERLFLLIAIISMSSLSITRHFLIKETVTGKQAQEKMRQHAGAPIAGILAGYRETFRYIIKNKRVASAVLINSLIYVYFVVGTTNSLFFTPYFTTYMNLSSSQVSLVGGVYAFGMLLSMFVLNPQLSHANIPYFTITTSSVSLLGFLILIFATPGRMKVILGGVFLVAISYGVLKTVADSLLAIETAADHRSGVYAFSFFFSSLVGIAVIAICTWLYAQFPGWLFIISGFLIAGVLGNSLWSLRTDPS
ncbi:MAG: MFS transporter [Sphaerochaetaceae bacterium]|nr:MFS transporter [Sphaerochaetaceae bacterium]